MNIFPIGENSNRYYGNLDVPDGGYIGNADGLPLIIFDYDNEALELGGTNITGAGSIEATGLTIYNCAVLGSDSVVFQPNADSTTFFQVKNAAGTAFLIGDSSNTRLGVRGIPGYPLDIWDGSIGFLIGADNAAITRTNATNKFGRMGCPHYTNAEQPIATFLMASLQFSSLLNIGGGSSAFNTVTDIDFYTAGNTTTTTGIIRGRINSNGNWHIGSGAIDAETLLELEDAAPYITLHNSTHEDSDGGRESRLIFKGEQSGEEETTLAMQEVGHDGAADDEKAYWDLFINFGSDGDAPTKVVRVDSSSAPMKVNDKSSPTLIGGWAVKLTNQTGSPTVAGQLVKADTASDDAVILTAAGDVECFGVFLDDGIADGSEAWVVVGGIADVAMGDNEASTHGNWVETNSGEAGYADATSASPAAAPQHFNEIGHCIESVAAGGGGTHILARCILHFN